MGSGWEQASWQEKRYIYAIYDVTLCNLVPLIFHSPSLCSEVLSPSNTALGLLKKGPRPL